MKILSKAYIRINETKYNKYICCMKTGWQEMLTYRFQYCMGFFLLFIPFAIKNCIWSFAFSNNKEIAGYTFEKILMYNCLMLIMGSLIGTNVHWEIANEIKSGDLSKYLAKPINHRNYWLSKWTGNKIGQIIYVTPLFVILYVVYPGAFNRIEFSDIIAGFIAFVLAYIMNFLIFYNLSLLSFYFLEISSFFAAFDLIFGFLNGEYLPIALMPEVWIQISKFLPFNSGIYFVVQAIMGIYSWKEVMFKVCIQLGWILFLGILASYSWTSGIKKYESVGI